MHTPHNYFYQQTQPLRNEEQNEQQGRLLQIVQQLQQQEPIPTSAITPITPEASTQQQLQYLQGPEIRESDNELLLLLQQDQQQQQLHQQKTLQKQSQQQQQQQLENYIPVTLNEHNKDRCTYLPTFPYMKSHTINLIPLLLANVSTSILGKSDLNRRYATYYDGPFVPAILSDQMESYMHDTFKEDFNDLIERLKINKAIIDFNLGRFRRIVERFQLLQKVFYRRHTHFNNNDNNNNNQTNSISLQQVFQSANTLEKLNQIELSIGLEYFLQIDVDLFYMKTCSFRDAYPRSLDEGLFCKSKLPTIRYSFQSCQHVSCTLCESPSKNLQFNRYQTHRFLNGYHTILNCPATCQTKNIIYALTCPCGEYDFVGSTSSTIAEVIECIRENGNHFIHETLISISASLNSQHDTNHILMNHKEFIRLYQHSARCAKAIQLFLNTNPQYDCFIPITYEQAIVDDTNHTCQQIAIDNFLDLFIQHVPMPPNGYTFSNSQRLKQRKFFENLTSTNRLHTKLWTSVDFYNVTIIAVLPETCTKLLREVLECLFVTHAETKLNMFNFRTTDLQQFYGLPYHRLWCENIVCPSLNTS